jgi:hypothetical protein
VREDVDMLVAVKLSHSKFNAFLGEGHFVAYLPAGIAKIAQGQVDLDDLDSLLVL